VIFNNSYTDATAGHALIATHCNDVGTTPSCHTTLSAAIATVGSACGPVLALLQANNLDTFIQNLKAAIVLTEMPCIRSDSDPTRFCFEDVISLRQISTDPGVGTVPDQTVLQQYCTPCIVKLFAAASTFAPDYARIQFALMASNCWQFPVGGEYCVLKFKALNDETAAEKNAENGTSLAHLDLLCDPCVRIFLRRIAILYADPIFKGTLLPAAHYLFVFIHTIDVLCLARTVGDYCVRELRVGLLAGDYNNILPGSGCAQTLVSPSTVTCPACADNITQFLTAHGCCAIALYRLATLSEAVNDPTTLAADNRDDPRFPANMLVTAFNTKCAAQSVQIAAYCTAVAVNFRITLRNIAVAYYEQSQANKDAFHALVIADIAEFLGMVAADISVAGNGNVVQGTSAPWYSSFVPSAFVPQDSSAGVTLSVNVNPDNDDSGAAINTYVSSSLSTNSIPFPNTASDVRYLADPTVAVTASDSSSATVVASFLLLAVLALLQL